MNLLTDIELAKTIGSEAFNGPPAVVKRRIRALAKEKNVAPVKKFDDFWLWSAYDITRLCSRLPEEQARRSGKSPEPYRESAFDRVRARTIGKLPRKYGSE